MVPALTALWLVGARASVLHAEPVPQAASAGAAETPWSRGVSQGDQTAALAAFEQGNEFFAERRYALAMEHYRRAITHWEHPAIHFNMTVCLIHMDRPIEAFAHVQHALAFDATPLGEDLYAQGLTYRKLLHDRLGHLKVSAAQRGAEVALDGQSLLTGPGSATRVLMPGRHQIVATLEGHLTRPESVELVAGRPLEVEIRLVPVASAAALERPFDSWIPWVVMGAGAIAGLSGLGLRELAASEIEAYDSGVASECPKGCALDMLSSETRGRAESADLLGGVAIGLLAAGGAALGTGLTLLILNQPRPVERAEARAFVGPRGAGVQVRVSM